MLKAITKVLFFNRTFQLIFIITASGALHCAGYLVKIVLLMNQHMGLPVFFQQFPVLLVLDHVVFLVLVRFV